MAFGRSVAKSINSPEMIFSFICGGTGGSDTPGQIPGHGAWPTLVVDTALGSVLVIDAGSVPITGVLDCCR